MVSDKSARSDAHPDKQSAATTGTYHKKAILNITDLTWELCPQLNSPLANPFSEAGVKWLNRMILANNLGFCGENGPKLPFFPSNIPDSLQQSLAKWTYENPSGIPILAVQQICNRHCEEPDTEQHKRELIQSEYEAPNIRRRVTFMCPRAHISRPPIEHARLPHAGRATICCFSAP